MAKIAVPCENGEVFQHFGKSPAFLIVEADGKKVVSSAVVSTDGAGHSALRDFLQSRAVTTVICGGMGGGAYTALTEAGMSVVRGQSGSAEAAVMFFLNGDLKDNPEGGSCHHHDGDAGGHSCGEHSCASHSCGGHTV